MFRRRALTQYWMALLSISAILYFSTRNFHDPSTGETTESNHLEMNMRDQHSIIASNKLIFKIKQDQNGDQNTTKQNMNTESNHKDADQRGGKQHLMRLLSENATVIKPWGDIPPQCQTKSYSEGLPRASVVVTFCDNEDLNTLLLTVHSVIQRSPPHLLAELILVDDNTHKDEFKGVLDIYGEAVFGNKMRVLRSNVTLGLIQARVLGAKQARGDVIILLDAHMEAQHGWLEPLLAEITADKKTIATSYVDWLTYKDGGWEYTVIGSTWTTYFDWDLTFGWQDISSSTRDQRKDPTQPIKSAVTLGCNVAIHKDFFQSLGWFDDRLKFWGAENIELAFKAWLCGGRVVIVPCSHIAHMERDKQRNYRADFTATIHNNYKVVADTWMPHDLRNKLFYNSYPHLNRKPIADTSVSSKLKKDCKPDFKHFLQSAIPELGIPYQGLAWGGLQHVASGLCVESKYNEALVLGECSHTPPLSQAIYWSQDGVLRTSIKRVHNEEDGSLTLQDYIAAHNTSLLHKWAHKQGGLLVHMSEGKCLEASPGELYTPLELNDCDVSNTEQQWSFRQYSHTYIALNKTLIAKSARTKWRLIHFYSRHFNKLLEYKPP